MADHAVERIRHLVGEEARQPEQQIPEDRRCDSIAEILGEAFDCGARHAWSIKAHRIAPDEMPDGLAPRRQPTPFERCGDRPDMFVKTALRQQDADDQRVDYRTYRTAAAEPFHRNAQSRRHADQHDHGDDAALAPAPFAAARSIELAVEKPDRSAGQHDRVRDMGKHRRQLPEQRVDRETEKQQQQRIVVAQRYHRPANLGYAACRVLAPVYPGDKDRGAAVRTWQPRSRSDRRV